MSEASYFPFLHEMNLTLSLWSRYDDDRMKRLGESQAFKDRNLLLKGADIATQKGWTGVPNFILESKEISMGAKLTYAMLLKYAREEDECFPGQERLANDTGCVPELWAVYLWQKCQFGTSRTANLAVLGMPSWHANNMQLVICIQLTVQ